jgi:hypothetical protein
LELAEVVQLGEPGGERVHQPGDRAGPIRGRLHVEDP